MTAYKSDLLRLLDARGYIHQTTDAPALDADWEQYFALEIDDASGAFTVTLNEDGTRLLRAFRNDYEAHPDRPTRREDITTTELRIPRPGDA